MNEYSDYKEMYVFQFLQETGQEEGQTHEYVTDEVDIRETPEPMRDWIFSFFKERNLSRLTVVYQIIRQKVLSEGVELKKVEHRLSKDCS